jgi:hypothetical protein
LNEGTDEEGVEDVGTDDVGLDDGADDVGVEVGKEVLLSFPRSVWVVSSSRLVTILS